MFSFLWKFLEVELMDHMVTTGASQVVLEVKNLPASAGEVRDTGSIPGFRRSPGREHGSPLHYSCLKNPMDREAGQTTVHGVARVRHDLANKLPPHIIWLYLTCKGRKVKDGNLLLCSSPGFIIFHYKVNTAAQI